MAYPVLLKHIALVLVVLIILNGTQGDRYKGKKSYEKCKNDLSSCISSGRYACQGTGYKIHCFSQSQRCDGIYDCPHGDDEQYCNFKIRPSVAKFVKRTVYRTTTSLTTTTFTKTSTTTRTAGSTFTSTVRSTSTTYTTSTTSPTFSLGPTFAYSTATFRTNLPVVQRAVQIAAGQNIAVGDVTCVLMAQGVVAGVAGAADYVFTTALRQNVVVASLTAACSPTITTIRC